MFCNIHDVCHYARRTATSYWLAANQSMSSEPVGEDRVDPFIGRCSVCLAPAPLITLHSQTGLVPDCPAGWRKLWTGFSFVMVRILQG